jgi:hypothetical protein
MQRESSELKMEMKEVKKNLADLVAEVKQMKKNK